MVSKGKSDNRPRSKRVFQSKEIEKEREQAFDTVQKEARKLPGIQRKIAITLMGGPEGKATAREARQRIGISTADFYREKEKIGQKLRKLKPIWVRFGKALRTTGDLT